MAEQDSTCASYLRRAREAVRTRREKIALNDMPVIDSSFHGDEALEKMKKFLSENSEIDFIFDLPSLVEKKAAEVTMEADEIKQDCEAIKRRIAGYIQNMGDAKEGSTLVGSVDVSHAMEQ